LSPYLFAHLLDLFHPVPDLDLFLFLLPVMVVYNLFLYG
jgi:hypothetical protein